MDVARRKAAGRRNGAAPDPSDHRAHPAVARLLDACPVPGLAAYVSSAPGPIPRPPRGRAAQLSDRLSVTAEGLAVGAEAAQRAAAAAAALASRPDEELIEAAGRCPHIEWAEKEGGGGDAAAATHAIPPAQAAPAVVALAAAGLATAATLRSRVAAALGDPGLLAADPAPLAAYGLLWGLAPFLDGAVVRAVAALEGALATEGGSKGDES